ncbi:hypothetical protein [Cellulomonas sp. 73-92]|uniref:hypothetical protein n=1 Tax=Cellulomonas sp. 73-92 TaxID=1895740 RepID=UPI00345D737F
MAALPELAVGLDDEAAGLVVPEDDEEDEPDEPDEPDEEDVPAETVDFVDERASVR